MRAASAIAAGSQPASCTATGPPQPSTSAMRRVVRFSRTIAQEAIISETTSPAPCCLARRRNGRSVTPDIGARMTGRVNADRGLAGAELDRREPRRMFAELPMIWAN